MKATTENKLKGLKSRAELQSTDANGNPLQLRFHLKAKQTPLKPALPYRLRAGDVVLYENRICPVLRVSECCAVLEMAQPAREFTTLFGKCVRIKSKPKLVRISSNSEVRILKRQKKGGAL
jgi:hypothetical protein